MGNAHKIILDGPNDEAFERLKATCRELLLEERQKKQECKKQKRAEAESKAK